MPMTPPVYVQQAPQRDARTALLRTVIVTVDGNMYHFSVGSGLPCRIDSLAKVHPIISQPSGDAALLVVCDPLTPDSVEQTIDQDVLNPPQQTRIAPRPASTPARTRKH